MTTTKDAPNLQLTFVEIVAPRLWMSTSENTTLKTTTPAAAFDVDNPSADWFDCGTIKAARLPVAKEKFEKKAGVPQTSRKQWEISRSAQITFNTEDLSPYVEALIMGQTIYNTLGTEGAESSSVASLYGGDTRIRQYVGTASTPTLAENNIVVCGSPGGGASLETCFNMAVVDSMNASLLTLKDAGFPVDPVAGDLIRKVDAVEFIDAMGADRPRSALLFWDTVDASGNLAVQNAVYFPKVYNDTGGDFDFKDQNEPYEVGVTLNAQAVQMTFSSGATGYNLYKKWVLAY